MNKSRMKILIVLMICIICFFVFASVLNVILTGHASEFGEGWHIIIISYNDMKDFLVNLFFIVFSQILECE